MTDADQIQVCAEVMGIDITPLYVCMCGDPIKGHTGLSGHTPTPMMNPSDLLPVLTNLSAAVQLAQKLGCNFELKWHHAGQQWYVLVWDKPYTRSIKNPDLCRAIVEAVLRLKGLWKNDAK